MLSVPRCVAGHGPILEPLENPVGIRTDILMRPEVEHELHLQPI